MYSHVDLRQLPRNFKYLKYIIQQVTCCIFVCNRLCLRIQELLKIKIRNIHHSNLITINQKIPLLSVLQVDV